MTYKKDGVYILLKDYRCDFSPDVGKKLTAGKVIVIKARGHIPGYTTMVIDVYDCLADYILPWQKPILTNISVYKSRISLEEILMADTKSAYEQLLEKQKSMDEQANALANDIRLLKKEFNDEDLRSLSMSDINIALTFIKFKDEKVPLAEKIKSIRSIISCLR